MIRITFNTPASNRMARRAAQMLKNVWSCSASLGSKRLSMTGEVEADQLNEIIAKLKALRCTSIRTV